MTSVNWAPPEVSPSAAYLARLQEFLAMQQPKGASAAATAEGGGGAAGGSSSSSNNKRKGMEADDGAAASESGAVDGALKDSRRAGSEGEVGAHSHAEQDDREDSSAEASSSTPSRFRKGSTTDKRKEQNRNAQRAFRERKEKVLRDLEDKVSELNKINEDQVNENQNLKELVSRLQAENARLQSSSSGSDKPAAPQADFTFNFSGPSSSSLPNLSSSSSANKSSGPASFSDADILSFLQQSQPPASSVFASNQFEIIPAPMPQLSGDDYFNWNSSAFGTEIPQAAPANVTNLTERFGNSPQDSISSGSGGSGIASFDLNSSNTFGNASSSAQSQDFARLFGFNTDANPNAGSTGSAISPATSLPSFGGSSNQPSPASTHTGASTAAVSPVNDSSAMEAYKALFGSLPQQSSFTQQQQQNQGIPAQNGKQQQQQQQQQGSRQGSVSGQNGNAPANLARQAIARTGVAGSASNGLGSADSPEATSSACSEPSSCTSENQPPTPNNGTLFWNTAGAIPNGTTFNNWFSGTNGLNNTAVGGNTDMFGQTSFTSADAQANAAAAASNNAAFSGIFGGNALSPSKFLNPTTPSGIFDMMNYRDPLFPGLNDSGVGSGSDGSRAVNDILDFNDFLVQSPPAMAGASPSALANVTAPPYRASSTSSSSVPGLSHSGSNSPSNTSSHVDSPQTLMSNAAKDMLPYEVKYSHPLIQHVMGPMMAENKKNGKHFDGTPMTDTELDSLCCDMTLKATCKDYARERIADSIASDETTLQLYNQYLVEEETKRATARM